jgi:hypothetical protein
MPTPKTIEERLARLEEQLSPVVAISKMEEVPAQPAKETEKMALPWQDISTLEHYEGDDAIKTKEAQADE